MPPGVEVERWWIVSNDPLVIGYDVKKRPTPGPTSTPPPSSSEAGALLPVDFGDRDLFRGILSEAFVDPSMARDAEVLDLLRDTLRSYVKDGDPLLGGPKAPTVHGPAHGASGHDPVLISVHQVIGLDDWIDGVSESVAHLRDINGYFSAVALATGQLFESVQALTSGVETLSGQYAFLRGSFDRNVKDQRNLESAVHGVTAEMADIRVLMESFPLDKTDEFEATAEPRYRLSFVPLADHPVRVWVGGLRNPQAVFSIEGQDLVFPEDAAPVFDPSGISDYIVVDYKVAYQQ